MDIFVLKCYFILIVLLPIHFSTWVSASELSGKMRGVGIQRVERSLGTPR